MQEDFKALRIVKTGKMELCANAKTVFPLLCPAKEDDWIDGWKDVRTLIYTASGIAEEACVFETYSEAEGKAIWICSKYDVAKTEIEYIKHILDKAIMKWKMEVKDSGANSSVIISTYIATGLTQSGNEFVTAFMEKNFSAFMNRLEDLINYYVSTGTMKKANLS